MKLKKIKRAIISVSNKSKLKNILSTLKKFNIEIISSGGSYKKIKNMRYSCIEVSKYTGFSEMLNIISSEGNLEYKVRRGGEKITAFINPAQGFYSSFRRNIEAGLRTNNSYSPFPEEINRRMTSTIAQMR